MAGGLSSLDLAVVPVASIVEMARTPSGPQQGVDASRGLEPQMGMLSLPFSPIIFLLNSLHLLGRN